MRDKIELRLDLKSLVYIWSGFNHRYTCENLIGLHHSGRYVSPPRSDTRQPADVVIDLRRCLNKTNEHFDVRLVKFKKEFNKNVELVFTGRTEHGRDLFERLMVFLDVEPSVNIPLWK